MRCQAMLRSDSKTETIGELFLAQMMLKKLKRSRILVKTTVIYENEEGESVEVSQKNIERLRDCLTLALFVAAYRKNENKQ